MDSADINERIDEMEVPYMVKGNQWIGYDDIQSLTNKVGLSMDWLRHSESDR